MSPAEIAPVRVVESRQCARVVCGAIFTPPDDDPDQDTCSRYCRSMLRMERAPTVAAKPVAKAPPLMPGSELIGGVPVTPPPPTVAPAATPAPTIAPQRGRMTLGPNHPDYGKPVSAATPPAPPEPPKPRMILGPNFPKAKPRRKRQPAIGRAIVVTAPAVATAACATCGADFQPEAMRPNHCSWPCVWATPADHTDRCLCLACSDARRERGLPPLVGMALTAASFEDERRAS